MAEAPRRLPRIGLLHWHLASKVKDNYCRELYRYFDERRAALRCGAHRPRQKRSSAAISSPPAAKRR